MLEKNKIYCMDCLEGMKQIPDKSIDLVLTDPPYGIGKEGFNDQITELIEIMPNLKRVCKDNAFFISFSSIGRLPDFVRILGKWFKYKWQNIYYVNNGMVRGALGFNRYQSILVYVNGDAFPNKPICDVKEVSTSSKECGKRQHPTQKNLDYVQYLISVFSKDGIVLDPFLGSSTTAVACKQLDRDFIGFEISQEYVDIAEKRLEQEVLSNWTN